MYLCVCGSLSVSSATTLKSSVHGGHPVSPQSPRLTGSLPRRQGGDGGGAGRVSRVPYGTLLRVPVFYVVDGATGVEI